MTAPTLVRGLATAAIRESPAALAACALWKSYRGAPALRGVDLAIAPGEVVGLIGPNGSGKSTLVSLIAGLLHPDEGTINVGGFDTVREPRRTRARISLAPQDIGLYPVLTGFENLAHFGRLAGLGKGRLTGRIDQLRVALGLEDLLEKRVATMSGGERRRVQTATAMLRRPLLLLLDEATSSVDVESRLLVLEEVRRLADEGTAVCYATHHFDEIDALGATIALLDHGQVIARGSSRELLRRHATPIIELEFAGPVPDLDVDEPTRVAGQTLQVLTERPAVTVVDVLARLGPAAGSLRSLEVIHPTLERVFIELTGRRMHDPATAGHAGRWAS